MKNFDLIDFTLSAIPAMVIGSFLIWLSIVISDFLMGVLSKTYRAYKFNYKELESKYISSTHRNNELVINMNSLNERVEELTEEQEESKQLIRDQKSELLTLESHNTRLLYTVHSQEKHIHGLKHELERCKMNLCEKYNKNVIRGTDGRFKSINKSNIKH